MTFLKRLGIILAQGLGIAAGITPLIAPFLGSKANQVVGVAINDLSAIGELVVQAEALLQGDGNGAEKLARAAPLVTTLVRTSELVSGHHIENEAAFTKGCTDLTSAVAEILNSLSAHGLNSGS
jgi:hypothetical protein